MMSSAARRAPSHWYLGIDRRFPQLPAAFDLAAASRLYEKRWHGRAQPGLRVRARRVHDVDYRPAARCMVTHELTLERGGDEPGPGGARPVGQTRMRRTPHITVGLGGRDDERFSLLRKGIYRAMPRESEPRLNIGYVVSTWPRLSQTLAVGSRA